MKKLLRISVGVAAVLLLFAVAWIAQFNASLRTTVPVDQYRSAELKPSSLVSRWWMSYAMEMEKEKNLAPASAARLYAYVASVFADTLDKTNDVKQAGAATALMLSDLLPDKAKEIKVAFRVLYGTEPTLSPEAAEVLKGYTTRASRDGYEKTWTPDMIPKRPDAWYQRGSGVDGGAMSGEWLPWILSASSTPDAQVPPPPTRGSIEDTLDLFKMQYAADVRTPADLSVIYFWQGATGAVKGQNDDNVAPAGVWQNIFFTEEGERLSEVEYAHAQKLLAQTLADSFIFTWRVKYKYYIQRPSMRLPELLLMLADPPFPSYVSGHSTVSASAATVLSAAFPDKKDVWQANARDARTSRLLAGIHFDSDNEIGAQFGVRLGTDIARALDLKPAVSVPEHYLVRTALASYVEYALLRAASFLRHFSFSHSSSAALRSPTDLHFTERAAAAGILESSGHYAAWGDYNNDGLQDLVVEGHLYKNLGGGKFADSTAAAGLLKGLASSTNAVFADYNNDGCEDLLVLRHSAERLSLYRNTCKGSFVDATPRGLAISGIPMGASWADYDKDGKLDLYIATFPATLTRADFSLLPSLYDNLDIFPGPKVFDRLITLMNGFPAATATTSQGRPLGQEYSRVLTPLKQSDIGSTSPVELLFPKVTRESNALFHNNGDGTFSDVTKRAGVVGRPSCAKYPPLQYALALTKYSYQPVWFDYNGDGLDDLFVSTDFWVSPLYRNNGDGTFSDVTDSAGLCRPGTGMGVAVSDIDSNGHPDLYVTNVGANYLWMNNGNSFTEDAEQRGVANEGQGWGTQFVDFGNRGRDDLYVTNGTVGLLANRAGAIDLRNLDEVYESTGKGFFRAVGAQAGIAGTEFKQASAAADYDGDGLVDMYVGAAAHAVGRYNALYKNDSRNSGHWLEITLRGSKSNADGIGAWVEVRAGNLVQKKEVLNTASYLSQDSRVQHFGLGSEKTADITITWPSGIVQTLTGVAADAQIRIVEAQP